MGPESHRGALNSRGYRTRITFAQDRRRLSWIFPGGGYFYTRHPLLGIGDAITEVLLSLVVLGSFIETIQGVQGAGGELVLWGSILAIEKAVTVYHSDLFIEEFIAKDKAIKPTNASVSVSG